MFAHPEPASNFINLLQRSYRSGVFEGIQAELTDLSLTSQAALMGDAR